MDRTVAPLPAARLRRAAAPRRWLPSLGTQRWLRRALPRGRRVARRTASLASRRPVRWLRVLAGVVVMAVLFAVLLSAAAPAAPAGFDAVRAARLVG